MWVRMCVRMCVRACVSGLQPKRLGRFLWKFTRILSRMFANAAFLVAYPNNAENLNHILLRSALQICQMPKCRSESYRNQLTYGHWKRGLFRCISDVFQIWISDLIQTWSTCQTYQPLQFESVSDVIQMWFRSDICISDLIQTWARYETYHGNQLSWCHPEIGQR